MAGGVTGSMPPQLPARVEDAPRIYESSWRERWGEATMRQVIEPSRLVGTLATLGAGLAGGGVLGALLGRRIGHGAAGAVFGALTLGAAAALTRVLPAVHHDPRHASGALPRPRLTDAQVAAIVAAEDDLERDTARPAAGPGALRNAHVSNTVEQLRMAMAGEFDSLEGDVRLEDGVPVMSHDRGGEDAVLFADWVRIAQATGKHLRIDLKEAAAIDQVSAILQQAGVPDEQLTLNVSTGDPLVPADMERGTLQRMRAAHPEALIGFNLPKYRPGDPDAPLLDAARDLGGPAQVSLAIGEADRERIAALRAAGVHVGVWNDPTIDPVDDPVAAAARLRALGVDGLIDLRRVDDPFQA